MSKRQPVRPTMCATCPFRDGSKYAHLSGYLGERSLQEARICHSTGSGNAINKRTGIPEQLCRGSRDIQLKLFHAMKVIEEPTDEAWEKKCKAMNL